ncbi:DUF859 family phage minor structural protein [Streptococcus pyogenes]|uniref:DUF859 family phage minor structural protein n=1 Tax=Streptococcus pyogenes TaxID=1314 RepID=UPI003CFE7F41
MVRVNFTGDYGPNLQLDLFSAWSTPIEGKNASLVNVQVILIANGYAAIYGSYPRTLWINVGGIQEQLTVDVGISQGQVKPLLQKNYEVPHNADGTRSINISTAIDINIGGYGVARAAFDLQLRDIARASKGGDVSATIGSPVNLTINRASDAFFHSIYVEYGTWKRSITGNTVTTNYSWTPPMELCEQTPDSTKGEGSITYITYQNGREIGRDVRRLTLTVPDTVRPSIASITVKDTNEKIAKFMKANTFVTILSNLKVDFGTATGAYGSTITKYNAFIVDKPYSAYTEEGIIGNVHYVGRAVVRATVTDSRGRVSEPKDIPVEFIDYYLPQISFDVKRVGANADQLQVTRNIKISPLTVDGVQKNKMKISFKVAQFGTDNFIVDNGLASGTFTSVASLVNSSANLGGRYPSDKSYIVVGTVEDNFTSSSYRFEVATRSVVMSMDQNGVGIGKIRERGALDVGGDIYANNQPIQQLQLTRNDGNVHDIRTSIRDCNDARTSGFYVIKGTIDGTKNSPSPKPGLLEVFNLNERESWQRYTTTQLESYIRFRNWGNTWGPWAKYNMVDNTPAKPADPVAPTVIKKEITWPWGLSAYAVRIGNTVTISISRTIKAITSQYENTLMRETIPEGFRPAIDVNMIITANERHNVIGNAIFHLFNTGEIRMTTSITQDAVWTGTITYLTEDPMPK